MLPSEFVRSGSLCHVELLGGREGSEMQCGRS